MASAKNKEVKFEEYRVVVRRSTVQSSVARFRMEKAAIDEVVEGEAEDRAVVRRFILPRLIPTVLEHEGFTTWPPTPDEFMELPEELWNAWTNANAELNPSWYEDAKELDPKVPTASTSDSQSS